MATATWVWGDRTWHLQAGIENPGPKTKGMKVPRFLLKCGGKTLAYAPTTTDPASHTLKGSTCSLCQGAAQGAKAPAAPAAAAADAPAKLKSSKK